MKASGMKIFQYRPEIDGMRAVAILPVIIYHLNGNWLPGGYLGVDIFFVLSGYLITTLLILEYEKNQRVDLVGFWSRRIRRLMPALFLILLAIAIYFAFFSSSFDRIGLRSDLLSALFYVANWGFIVEGQSYFEDFESVSYVRHTWSLAIEEQFYLIWPVAISLLFRLRKQRYVPVLLTLLIAISIFLMGFLHQSDPSRAYFGTDTRVHQLLIGVSLAFLLTGSFREKVLKIGYQLIPWSVAGIIVCFIFLNDATSFYYRGGSVVIALSTAVLISGLEANHPIQKFFRLRMFVSVGLISYGMYLWHWPVIQVIRKEVGPTSNIRNAVISILITLVISAISYRCIEKPLRNGKKLFRWKVSPKVVLLTLPIASGLLLIVILVSTLDAKQPEWASAGEFPQISVSSNVQPSGEESLKQANKEEISIGDSSEDEKLTTSSNDSETPSTTGVIEEPEILTIGIVGDSVAVSLLPGLRANAQEEGFELIEAAIPACPIGYEPLYSDDGEKSPYADNCLSDVPSGHEILINGDPDIIIWHDLQSVFARKDINGVLLSTGTPEWENALQEEWTKVLNRFQETNAEIFLILPPLRSTVGLDECSTFSRCVDIQFQDKSIREVTLKWWKTIKSASNVFTLELDSFLCPTGNPCPEKINGVEIRLGGNDQTHFTEDGANTAALLLMDNVIELSSKYNQE